MPTCSTATPAVWFDPDRLSGAVRSVLSDSENQVLVSAASVWELSLKHHQSKLPELASAIADLPGLLQADGFEALPISLAHGIRAGGYSQPLLKAQPSAQRWHRQELIRKEAVQLWGERREQGWRPCPAQW